MRKYSPMLSTPGSEKDLALAGFIYEPKWDGTRALLYKDSKVRFLNRRGFWIEKRYPELMINKNIKGNKVVLDGEIVVFDKNGKPDFNLLQRREQTDSNLRVEILAKEIPATYVVFDVLVLNGKEVMKRKLLERKKILENIVTEDEKIVISPYTRNGKKLFRETKKMKLEGVMAKNENSLYQETRSKDWIKIKHLKTMDCVIIGYTKGRGNRAIGAFCLGLYKNKKLFYVGKVGTGWDKEFENDILTKLKRLELSKSRAINKPNIKARWVKPVFVCEVRFMNFTKNKELRAPSFKGLRYDKNPKECVFNQ